MLHDKSDDNTFSGYFGDAFQGIGTSFTSFEVIHQSKMFRVVKAERYGRRWILKALNDEYVDDATARQLLRKEFEIMNMVSDHPNIVTVSGIEDVPEFGTCIVMEYIDGVNLDRYLSGRIGKKGKRRLTDQLLKTVAYIHSKGVVHRDLKPSNVMVTDYGGVKIIDFGVADTYSHTVLRQAAGTPRYMSAEQFETPVADIRNDIYSIGVIMRQFGMAGRRVTKKCMNGIERRYRSINDLLHAIDRNRRIIRALLLLAMLALAIGILTTLYFVLGEKAAPVESAPITAIAAPVDSAPLTQAEPTPILPEIREEATSTTPTTPAKVDNDTVINWERYGAAWHGGASQMTELFGSWPVKLHIDTLKDIRYYNRDYEKMPSDFEEFPARYVESLKGRLNTAERKRLLEELIRLQGGYKVIIPSEADIKACQEKFKNK